MTGILAAPSDIPWVVLYSVLVALFILAWSYVPA
jgi:hypothetical protein